MKKQVQKFDYSLSYRIKSKDGIWGKWHIGHGQWISLELVQKQIQMLVRSQHRTIEIEFKKDGQLLDYHGNKTEKNIVYETR